MTLPWVRLDTAWPRNTKVLNLLAERNGHRALVAWVSSLCYAGEQGTDGYVPAHALAFVHATKKDADALVAAGLWRENGTGWHINDWAEYQPSSEEVERRGARARWLNCRKWHEPDCTCSPAPPPKAP